MGYYVQIAQADTNQFQCKELLADLDFGQDLFVRD